MTSARLPLDRTGNSGAKSRAARPRRRYLLPRVGDRPISWTRRAAGRGSAAGGSSALHPRRQARGDELRLVCRRTRCMRQGRRPGRPLRSLEARARGAGDAAGCAHLAARRRRRVTGRRAVGRKRVVVRRRSRARDRALRSGYRLAPARATARGRTALRRNDRAGRISRTGGDRIAGPERRQRACRRSERSASPAIRARWRRSRTVRSPGSRPRGCSTPIAGRSRSCRASTPARRGWRSRMPDGRSGSAASGTRPPARYALLERTRPAALPLR